MWYQTLATPGVVLEYFTTALGDALTPEAGQGWANFMDLCIEVVTETAKGKHNWSGQLQLVDLNVSINPDDETYKKTVMKNGKEAWKQQEQVDWSYVFKILSRLNYFLKNDGKNIKHKPNKTEIWTGEDDKPSLPIRPRKFAGHGGHAEQDLRQARQGPHCCLYERACSYLPSLWTENACLYYWSSSGHHLSICDLACP